MNEYNENSIASIDTNFRLELVENLNSQLCEVIDNLLLLNTSTEEEFLLTGSNLNDYKIRCKKLIDNSTELSDELSGEVLLSKISHINSMSKDLLENIQSSSERNQVSFQLLNEIESLLIAVHEQITGFKKIIKILKMLGVSTLIESARLGDDAAGFNALAIDVESLADNIEDKSLRIDEATKQLTKLIRETIGNNISLGKEQQGKIKTIISELGTDLIVLEEKHTLKLDTVGVILNDSGNINNDVSQVVTSVQFHDITRQQIEHVINSLKNVFDELSDITPETPQEEVEKKLALVRDVSSLESAQLENSGKIFYDAVENIKTSLEDIQNNIGDIAKNIIGFLSDSEHQGNSFLNEITSGLNSVNLVLHESSEINQQLKNSLNEVGETVTTLSHFLHLIEEIGEEVELLAINASIKAAHTGSEGAALGVIADSIQKLSSEAMEQTILVSRPLKKLTKDAKTLTDKENKSLDNDIIEKEISDITSEMSHTMKTIEEINNNSSSSLKNLNEEVVQLQSDIQDLNMNLTIHTKTNEVVQNCKKLLESVVSQCIAKIGGKYKSENNQILNKIAERYTMLSERQIHSMISEGGNLENEFSMTAMEPELADGEFGENIELF